MSEKGGEEDPPTYESLGFDLDGKRMMSLPQNSEAALTPPASHPPVKPLLAQLNEVLKEDIIDLLPFLTTLSRNPTLALGRHRTRKRNDEDEDIRGGLTNFHICPPLLPSALLSV